MCENNTFINNKDIIIRIAIFSIFVIFTFCLYAPMEIYLTNRGEFWFNLRILLQYVLLFSMAAFMVAVAVGIIIWKLFGLEGVKAFCTLAFAAGICVYIQGNFLNIKLGELNGRSIDWKKYNARMALDFLVYFILISIVLTFIYVRMRHIDDARKIKVMLFIASTVIVMQLSQLVVLLVPAIIDGELSELKKNILTTNEIDSLGSENVVVLVVDSFDKRYVNEWIENHPEQHVLDGFTFFENYTCVYPNTIPNMTTMFVEDIFRNEKNMSDWANEKYEDDVFWKDLIKDEYKLSIYTDNIDIVPSGLRDEIVNNNYVLLTVNNKKSFFHHIYRLVICRYGPNILKKKFWMNGTEFDDLCSINTKNNEAYNIDNASYINHVLNDTIKVEEGKTFKLFHIWGAHEPYTIDSQGSIATESDYKSTTEGIMILIDAYIASMKEKGIYDDSVFVIMGDHGNNGKHNVMSSPAFLIKYKNSDGNIAYDNNPMSHVDFGRIILDAVDLAEINNNSKEPSGKRYYYAYVYKNDDSSKIEDHGNPELVEYVIPSNSSDPWDFERTGIEYAGNGKKVDHERYCKVCKNNEVSDEWLGWWRVDYHRHSFDYPFK